MNVAAEISDMHADTMNVLFFYCRFQLVTIRGFRAIDKPWLGSKEHEIVSAAT
jgi:hypothetical protein